jgi:hypothetical protein
MDISLITSWCRRVWRRASLLGVYIRAVFMLWITGRASTWECITGTFPARVSTWTIQRILCFREPPAPEDEPYDLDFLEIDPTSIDVKEVDQAALDVLVSRNVPSDWTSWRIEIRCQRGPMKRRVVIRRGEPVHLLAELKTARPYRVLGCMMHFGVDSDHHPLDIKSRFDKYIVVPYRTFLARDIFPFDDHHNMPGCMTLRTFVTDDYGTSRFENHDYAFCSDTDVRASCWSS